MRLIIGISGASGVMMGYQLLQALIQFPNVETHLVITEGAETTFNQETHIPLMEVKALSNFSYDNKNLGATIASGTFKTDGMIVIPCSMKSLAAISCGYGANLLVRAVDVCLKESRKVVLVPREMPLSKIHLRNMLTAAENGCTIIPPMLTFYSNYPTTEGQVDHIIGKILMQFELEYQHFSTWTGVSKECMIARRIP